MREELRTGSIAPGLLWASKMKKSAPHWLVRLYPDIIRVKDKDGVTCAWKRNSLGPQDYIEVVWDMKVEIWDVGTKKDCPHTAVYYSMSRAVRACWACGKVL